MSDQTSKAERAKLSPAERLKLLEQTLGELTPAERQALGQTLLGAGGDDVAEKPAPEKPVPLKPEPRPKSTASKQAISQFSLGEDRTNPAQMRKQLWSCLALGLLILLVLVGVSYGIGKIFYALIGKEIPF